MSNNNEEPRVETQTRVYNLRSGVRQREHVSPSAGRVSLSPAHDDVISDEQEPTQVPASQQPLFDSGEFSLQNGGGQLPPISHYNGNVQEQVLDSKKKIIPSTIRCERLSHHLSFLKDCKSKDIIPTGLVLEKTINPMKSCNEIELDDLRSQIHEVLLQVSDKVVTNLIIATIGR